MSQMALFAEHAVPIGDQWETPTCKTWQVVRCRNCSAEMQPLSWSAVRCLGWCSEECMVLELDGEDRRDLTEEDE